MSVRYTEAEVVARIDGLTIARLHSFAAARCAHPELREADRPSPNPTSLGCSSLCELCADFDLDEDASALVLSLVDQVHGLRRELRALVQALEQDLEEVRQRLASRLSARGASS